MALPPEQLEQHLARQIAPLYVVHGDEELLVLEAGDRIRAAARGRGFDERMSFAVEGRFNWQEPLRALQGGSLFASRTLLELRLNTAKLSVDAANGLTALIAALHDDSLLLLSCPRLDKTALASAWCTAAAARGELVPIVEVDRRSLPRWIATRLARQGQTADDASLAFIAERVEGNLLAAHQEVIKLGLLCPPGKLALEQVRTAVLNVARYDVYQLSEAMLTGDVGRFARILEGLRQEGEAPLGLVWTLAEDLRATGAMQKELRQGGSAAAIAREWRLWGDRQRWVESASRRYSPRAVWNALSQMALVDRAGKGVADAEPWQALRQLPLILQGHSPALPPLRP